MKYFMLAKAQVIGQILNLIEIFIGNYYFLSVVLISYLFFHQLDAAIDR